MGRAWVLGACIATASPLGAIKAQGHADSLAIEVAAARAMLGHQYNKGPVSIDPVEAANGHAPSYPGVGKRRPGVHTAALAKALSVAVLTYSDVSRCTGSQMRCAMSGTSAHLVLSAPRFNGDTAIVTGTIYQNSPSTRQPTDYETVLLTIVRTTRGWAVVKEFQLGMS